MLYNIPIESLEERYSKQWNKWFPEQFDKYGIRYTNIYPNPLREEIKDGAFLDVVSTNHFKAQQLQEICYLFHHNLVKNGDIFFFHDLWFPGIEMLAYIRDGLKIDFKIYGIMHAGTWDDYDFLHRVGMTKWAYNLEKSWFVFIDGVFVATDFHKRLIYQRRSVNADKLYRTWLPIYPDDFMMNKRVEKEKIIVFPHRLDPEKRPEEFDHIKDIMRGHWFEWKFLKTKEECKNKTEYYDLLSRSKIALSFSSQETWGIAMQEAVFAGCIPVVPNRLSYKEIYPEAFRYNNLDECVDRCRSIMQNESLWYSPTRKLRMGLRKKGHEAIPKMLTIMGLI